MGPFSVNSLELFSGIVCCQTHPNAFLQQRHGRIFAHIWIVRRPIGAHKDRTVVRNQFRDAHQAEECGSGSVARVLQTVQTGEQRPGVVELVRDADACAFGLVCAHGQGEFVPKFTRSKELVQCNTHSPDILKVIRITSRLGCGFSAAPSNVRVLRSTPDVASTSTASGDRTCDSYT